MTWVSSGLPSSSSSSRREVHLRPAGAAVGGQQPQLRSGRHAGLGERTGDERRGPLAVGGMDEIDGRARAQHRALEAGDRAQRDVDAGEAAVTEAESLPDG